MYCKLLGYIVCACIAYAMFAANESLKNEILELKIKTNNEIKLHDVTKQEKNRVQSMLDLKSKELEERKFFIKNMNSDEDLERRVNNYIEKVKRMSKEIRKANTELQTCQLKLQDILDNKVNYKSKFVDNGQVNIEQKIQLHQSIAEADALLDVLSNDFR
jgi:seryl-tRNA synthetase